MFACGLPKSRSSHSKIFINNQIKELIMKNKRGALQLSITTIIIVVIGITLLVLGLVWVRGIFEELGELSEKTFDEANTLLGNLEDPNSLLTLTPDTKKIEQNGDGGVITIWIVNLETDPITVSAKTVTGDNKLDCKFFKAGDRTEELGPYTLNSGDQKELKVIVQDNGGNIRTTGCDVVLSGVSTVDNERTIIVRVEKKSGGIFG